MGGREVLYLKTDWLEVSVSCSCQKSLHGAPECTVCQAMKVIDKSQWRPQDIGNAGNMGHFLRRAAGTKWGDLKEATYAKGSRVDRSG